MKVLVTGATGHLGTYVVRELISAGHDVVAASRSGAAPQPNVRALTADVTQDEAVAALAVELDPDVALVHLAAWHPPATAATTSADRRELIDTNVFGTMRVLEAARRTNAGARAVVYASTFEVYGDTSDAPITERSRVKPLTDYGASKLVGEDHLLAFSYEEQTRAVALRFPAVYGPGEHTPRALPNFLAAVARGEAPVIQGDGADLRDQVHARDAAVAIRLAVEGSAEGIFNLADGAPHSIAELARTAMRVAGLSGEPAAAPRVKPRRDYHMSIARARAELGFEPQVSLEQGMAEQLEWLRSGPQHRK